MSLVTKPSWKAYDDEFKYDDAIEQRIPEIMEEVESRPISTKPSTQALELLAKLYEQNVEIRKQYRITMQDEWKQHREGRIFHMNEFLYRLRKLGLNAWYTDKGGMGGTLGLFVGHDGIRQACQHEEKEGSLCQCHVCRGNPHYVCFVQVPFMQEYEELHFDRYDVPLGVKRRGWRTVLLRLIEHRLITEKQAHAVFGEPSTGPVSRRYREILHQFRNRPAY